MREFSRSLHTKDSQEARKRCLAASQWFGETMKKIRSSPGVDRSELEAAAAAFFGRWSAELDQPRQFDIEHRDEDVAFSIESSLGRVRDLDQQLIDNVFDQQVATRAREIVEEVGADIDQLSAAEKLFAQKVTARAERELMRRIVHELSMSHRRFIPEDELFLPTSAAPAISERLPRALGGMSLREAVARYLQRQRGRRLGQSQVDEISRVLTWLRELIGDETPIASITKADLRTFRDDLYRLNVRLRGQGGAFQSRLTNKAERQIKSVTALRYWRSVQSFFAWCQAEDYSEFDPSAGLKLDQRKGEKKKTPPPFTSTELQQLFKTPLYSGYLSPKRITVSGQSHRREGHWWSGVLLMFTGLRGGELSQLLPDDFVFDAEIPHLKVREENESGVAVKTAKTAASVRDVPLAPILLTLGLKQFVEHRAEISATDRVLREFRLGTKGKKSDGLSKFWAGYLRKFSLWKEGRSTHVWRHTLIANLRGNGVAEEDIASLVGHSRGTVTAAYGGAYPLHRKLHTVEKLDFGFDVVGALGGEFNVKVHG